MMPRTPNTGQAVEYLRRSVERDKSADKDRGAGQRAANAEQAARDGVTITRTFAGDWGTSGGRGARAKRAAMADLIDAVRAGEVSRVYCHTTDRLARDVEYGMTLWNACKDAGTILRPGSQTFDPRDPGYLTLWAVLLSQAEEDLDRITAKNQDAQDFGHDHAATCPLPGRPHRGRCHLIGCTDTSHCPLSHKRGRVPYGQDPSHPEEVAALARLVALWSERPTYLAVAKAANAEHLPNRFPGAAWHAGSVSRILRHANVASAAKGRRGARAKATRTYAGLLRCGGTIAGRTCGAILTSQPRPDGRNISYLCRAAHNDATHSRPYSISERYIEPWVRAEVARMELEADAVTIATDNAAERASLAAKRARWIEQYGEGLIDRAERDRRLAAVDAQLAALGATEALIEVPEIVWDGPGRWTPADLNAVLRRILASVTLGPDLRPLSAEWWNPALRRG